MHLASLMEALVWPKVIKNIVDAALLGDPDHERKGVEWLARRIVIAFALGRSSTCVGID